MSMQGYEMRFPIIRIRDKVSKNNAIHIVGTNSHDQLCINGDGGIDYLNLQCCEGTLKNGAYEFIGNSIEEWCSTQEIEFVTIDELLNIYCEQMEIASENEIAVRELIKKSRDKLAKEVQKSREDGITYF